MITPAVVIDYEVMMNNIGKIQAKCHEKKVMLRPHFKAHKTPYLAQIQKDFGAVGFTTAKISEAELLVDEGFEDILVAYPIATEVNSKRLKLLSEKTKVSTIVDSKYSIDILNKIFDHKNKLDVYIKIDTGLNRCGLKPEEDIIEFAKYIKSKKGLNLLGLLTHAGHSYKSQNLNQLREIAMEEGHILIKIKENLEKINIHVKEISVGSTPTANFVLDVEGITQIRPGNYIFNDFTQVSLGVAEIKDCALTIKSTVVSGSKEKVIIDCGSKTVGLDKGTHGNEIIKGFGKILEYPDSEIYALSEEHGFVRGKELPKIGETITIIPNHSCVVMNLAPFAYLRKKSKLEKIYNKGRGLNY